MASTCAEEHIEACERVLAVPLSPILKYLALFREEGEVPRSEIPSRVHDVGKTWMPSKNPLLLFVFGMQDGAFKCNAQGFQVLRNRSWERRGWFFGKRFVYRFFIAFGHRFI